MKRVLFFVLVSILGLHQAAYAATKADVAKAIELMKAAKSSGKLLDYNEFGYSDGTFQCVYIVGSKRYTAFYTPNTEGGWLAFWVRPNGTTKVSLVETFSDHRFDGKVDDEDNQEYYQSLYDKAIVDAIKRLK